MLIKVGAGQLGVHLTLTQVLHDPMLVFRFGFRIIENSRLFIGYSLYGLNTVLMAYALKGRELSRLYPIIALTYVWVTGLSVPTAFRTRQRIPHSGHHSHRRRRVYPWRQDFR